MESPVNREVDSSGKTGTVACQTQEMRSTLGGSVAEPNNCPQGITCPQGAGGIAPEGGGASTGDAGDTHLAAAEGGAGTGFRKRPIFLDFDLLQLAAIFFLLDQLTKFLVTAYLPFGSSYPSTGFFRFTHAENTGSAFGLFQGHNTPLIAISIIGIFVLAMIYQSQPRVTNLLRLSLGLQVGGALGNLVDRFRLGAVTDFIDVGPWPIFNLADSSIICGLLLLGWIILQPRRRMATTVAVKARDYSQKRRGRCVGCGRLHSGRRAGCRALGLAGGSRRPQRRTLRR